MSSLHLILLATALMTGLFAVSIVAATPPVPTGGTSLLPPDALGALKLEGSQAALSTLESIEVADRPFTKALKIASKNGALNEWNIQASANTVADIRAGDVVLIRLSLRCTESMTGEGSAGIVLEEAGGEYAKAVEMRLGAERQWAEQFVPFKARRDFLAGKSHFCIRVGYDRQTIEIGGLSVINYGPGVKLEDLPQTRITYLGREPNAAWRAAAAERIEKFRKGDLAISVVDAAGKPVSGAAVDVAMKRHAFAFGTCVDAKVLIGESAESQKFRDVLASTFTSAVFENDMKWPAVVNGIPPETDKALAWLKEYGFRVRGHNLVWPSWRWSPKEIGQYKSDPVVLRAKIAEHITQTVKHWAGQLYQWDVVNEPYSEHDLMDVAGGRELMIDWFKLAHAADPAAALFVNDFGIFDSGRGTNEHEEHFFKTIQFLKDGGAPLGGIGIQSHFTSDLPGPEELVKTLDRFSTFGLPIESTELSVNLTDRTLQADYLRDYVTVCFSHPNVNGIMLWGIWSKRHWRPDAALWGDDWKIRPHGQAYLDLIQKRWMTHASLKSDAAGKANVRGFCGKYEVTVKLGDKTKVVPIDLPHDGVSVTITIN